MADTGKKRRRKGSIGSSGGSQLAGPLSPPFPLLSILVNLQAWGPKTVLAEEEVWEGKEIIMMHMYNTYCMQAGIYKEGEEF